MKLNEFIFDYFDPIPEKQWKQKIQFELNGKDYQQSVVHPVADGITCLPYYTHSQVSQKLDYSFNVTTRKTLFIEVGDNEKEANTIAQKAASFQYSEIHFLCFNKLIDLETLIAGIQLPIFLNCQFLDTKFAQKVENLPTSPRIRFAMNPLGKLIGTGNWYRTQEQDFEQLQRIAISSNFELCIDLSQLHNAGADYVQQLAYAMSQLNTYKNQSNISSQTRIVYLCAVSTEAFYETAKLKALRIWHKHQAERLHLNPNCRIIVVKSNRNSCASDHIFNKHLAQIEQLIGYAGQADCVNAMSQSQYYFKEDFSNYLLDIEEFASLQLAEQAGLIADNIFVEKLTQQFLNNGLDLYHNMELGHGFLVQFKKGIIQNKIEKEAVTAQKVFSEKTSFSPPDLKDKTPLKYPFFKAQKPKTKYRRLLSKRLFAPLEKPHWDETFK